MERFLKQIPENATRKQPIIVLCNVYCQNEILYKVWTSPSAYLSSWLVIDIFLERHREPYVLKSFNWVRHKYEHWR